MYKIAVSFTIRYCNEWGFGGSMLLHGDINTIRLGCNQAVTLLHLVKSHMYINRVVKFPM